MGTLMKRTPIDAWVANRVGIELKDLSQDKLTEWQLESFRNTMRYAKANSRFYMNLFKGINPEDICNLEDLKAIPCTSEEDLVKNEMEFLCVNQKEVNRIVTVQTTGTLGHQKRICFSQADQVNTIIFMAVGFKTLIKPPATVLVMMSGGAEGSIGRSVEKALKPDGITTFIYGTVGSVSDAYEYLCHCRPNVIVGVPNQIAAICRYGQMFNNPEAEFISSVLLSADDIPDSLRDSISRLWGCKVFNHYGMTEFGIAGGVECEGFFGYHTRDCDLLYEIINCDKNGIGEIVFTTLGREAMPLIRYKTGDLGKFTQGNCPCGSPLKRIEKVYGRKKNNFWLFNGDTVQLAEIGQAVFQETHIIDYECTIIGDIVMEIELKTFPRQKVDQNVIIQALKQNSILTKAINEGLIIKFKYTETYGFPKEGNKKKTIKINKEI